MPTALPEREINVILEELSRLLDMTEPDALRVRRLDSNVERLWQLHAMAPEEYHFTKAFVAFAKRQRAAAIAAGDNALRLAPRNDVVMTNVLTVKVGLLQVDEAVELMRDMVVSHPDNKGVITDVIVKAGDLMQFSLVAELLEIYDKLAVNDPSNTGIRRASLDRNIAAMKRAQFSDVDIANRIKSAAAAVTSAGHEIWRTSRTSLEDGTLLYYMHVEASSAVCAELSFLIADNLVEQFDNPGSDFVSFACRPLLDLDEMEALAGARQ